MAADGTKLAKLLETKWLRRLVLKYTQNILSALLALAFRELTGGRRDPPIAGIGDQSAIAGGPHIRTAAQAHVGLSEQPAFLLGRDQPFNQRSGRVSHRAKNSATLDEAAAFQTDTFGRRKCYPSVQHDFYTCLFHF